MSAINADRIKRSTGIIEDRTAALDWLQKVGIQLTGKKDDVEGEFKLSLYVGEDHNGFHQARNQLEQFARANLPLIVQHATEACRNDIALARAAIQEEIDKL